MFYNQFFYANSLSYADAFAWEYFVTSLVWGIPSLIGTYILSYFLKCAKIKNEQRAQIQDEEKLLREDAVNYQESVSDMKSMKSMKSARPAVPINKREFGYKLYLSLYILSSITSWFALFCFAIAPSVLSSLGVIPIPLSMGITFIMFIPKFFTMVVYRNPLASKSKRKRKFNSCCSSIVKFLKSLGRTVSLYKKTFIAFGLGAIAFSVLVPLGTVNSCMTHFNDGYGFSFQGFSISTKFTRYLEIDTACPQGLICHVYATLPEDASTSVFINVHTGNDIDSIMIKYDTVDNQNLLRYNATSVSLHTDLETRGDRYVHTVYLSGLLPNTEYYLEVHYNDQSQGSWNYLTLPSEKMERNFFIIAGGDVGNTATARQMTTRVADFQPDVISLGGDLAYDNGIASCYYSYDLFFNMFDTINKNAGRLVPLMVSVGNHDLGLNAFQGANIDITKSLFYTYFPRHSKKNEQGDLVPQVPNLTERLSYSYHKIGNTLQLCLDSGYMTDYFGPQLDFLKSTIQNASDLIKMANYHVPIYPVCEQEENDPRTVEHPLLYWSHLFQAYKFAGIFENHAHLFKRTFPIYNGLPNPNGDGVVYYGDGNWGVSSNPCWPSGAVHNQTGIFEQMGSSNNVWIINVSKMFLTLYSIDQIGNLLTEPFKLNNSKFLMNK